MKESKEYSQKLKKFYNALKREYPKNEKVVYEDPIEAFVYGIISEIMEERKSHEIKKRFLSHFIDLNGLRVSLIPEIVEVIGENSERTRLIASNLIKSLTAVFNKNNVVSLENLKKLGKRPARQALEAIEGATNFIVDYVMLTALDGHAIPLTAPMINYLKREGLVHPESDLEEIEGFLTRQISANNGYEFYYLLREETEKGKLANAGKSKAAKKTVKGKK